MKSKRRQILFLSVAISAFFSSVFLTYMLYYAAAQRSGTDTETGVTEIEKMASPARSNTPLTDKWVKPEGWHIPEIKDAALLDTDSPEVQDLFVTRRSYKLKKRIYTKVDFYSFDSKGSKKVETKDLAINHLLTFSYKEMTFGYQIIHFQYAVSAVDGSKALVGEPIRIYYEDGDGDGTFESRYDYLDFPPHAPEWVMKLKTDL